MGRRALPFLLFAAITAFLFRESFFQGKAFAGSVDRVQYEVPLLQFAANSLSQGQLPLWNPFNFAGSRGWGDPVLKLLYPLNSIPLALFPSHVPLVSTWRIILECLLMMVLAYLFFLKVWKDEGLAIFSSLAYSLSTGVMTQANSSNTFSSFVFFPLVLWALLDWDKKPFLRAVAALGAAMALQLAAGFVQFTAYLFAFAFLWSAFRILNSNKKLLPQFLVLFASASFLALAVNAPEILSFLESRSNSGRVFTTFENIWQESGQPWWMISRLLVPFLFGDMRNFPLIDGNIFIHPFETFMSYAGISSILFCAFALTQIKRREIWGWVLGFLVLALMSLKTPFFRIPYELFGRAPLLHGRLSALVPIALAFLAPYGILIFLNSDERKRKLFIAAGALGAALILLLGAGWLGPLSWEGLFSSHNFNLRGMEPLMAQRFWQASFTAALFLALPVGAMAAYHFQKIDSQKFKLACALILALDLSYFAREHTLHKNFMEESLWYPQSELSSFLQNLPERDLYRTSIDPGIPWSGSSEPFDQFQFNYNLVYGTRDINGYFTMINGRYSELVAPGKPGLRHIPYHAVRSPQMADLLSIRYFAAAATQPSWQIFSTFTKQIAGAPGVLILEKPQALPRLRLACRVVAASGVMDTLTLAHHPQINLMRDVLAEPSQHWDFDWSACRAGQETLNAEKVENGNLRIRVRTTQPRILVFTETYDPGWRARLDGVPVRINRVNHAFQAVEIPAGEHLISLRFEPFYLMPAFLSAILSALMLAALWLWK